MVSKASEDLPDPDRPVNTIRALRGRSRWMFLRLCSRAPRMTRRSVTLRVPSSVRGEARWPPHCMDACDNNVPPRSDIPQEAHMTQFDSAHVDRGGPPHRYAGGPL